MCQPTICQSVPPASIGNIWDLRSRLIFFIYFLRSFRTVPWTRLWCKGGHCEHETEGFPFCLHKYISLFSWVNIEYGFRMGLNSLFSVSLYFLNGLGRWKGQETGWRSVATKFHSHSDPVSLGLFRHVRTMQLKQKWTQLSHCATKNKQSKPWTNQIQHMLLEWPRSCVDSSCCPWSCLPLLSKFAVCYRLRKQSPSTAGTWAKPRCPTATQVRISDRAGNI